MASLAPEVLGHIGSLPITNTTTNTLLVDAVILIGVYFLYKGLTHKPGMFQNIMEFAIETFYNFNESISGNNVVKIFPYVMSFFLFILLANWSGLIPGMSSIGMYKIVDGKRELVPFFKNATSDLNVTFGLSIVSLIATHILSIQRIGIKEYVSRYVSLNPINLFVGLLEIVSEITKVISLSFRLFGNIYAGEVVLATISTMFAFLFPIPFLLLETIVGLVQALVFSILTLVFMTILMTPHHAESHPTEEVSDR